MNARKALTAALLGFVVVSFGYLALRSVRAAREWRSPAAAEAAYTPVSKQAGRVIAYYFHVTVRCTTCRNIEAYSREAIHRVHSGWALLHAQLRFRSFRLRSRDL